MTPLWAASSKIKGKKEEGKTHLPLKNSEEIYDALPVS
jgi:hypothetical protein